MATLETLVRHAGHRLDWVDRSGYVGADLTPLADSVALAIRFTALPAGVRAVHKAGSTVLLGGERSAAAYTVAGAAGPAHLAPPAAPPYAVAGTMRDPAGRFNPRAFADPDPFSPARVRRPAGGGLTRTPELTVQPGTVTRLASHARDWLELR
ncbi:MAG: hypothetical protein ACYDA8_03460 [Deferrisomatales bacterium]